jgi:hypothetical protein
MPQVSLGVTIDFDGGTLKAEAGGLRVEGGGWNVEGWSDIMHGTHIYNNSHLVIGYPQPVMTVFGKTLAGVAGHFSRGGNGFGEGIAVVTHSAAAIRRNPDKALAISKYTIDIIVGQTCQKVKVLLIVMRNILLGTNRVAQRPIGCHTPEEAACQHQTAQHKGNFPSSQTTILHSFAKVVQIERNAK